MNKSSLIAAVALLSLSAVSTLSAHAGDITVDQQIAESMSTKTRAEVRAELLQARADGSLEAFNETFSAYHAAMRQQQRATRLATGRALPPVLDARAAMLGEDSGSFALTPGLPGAPARAVPIRRG